MKRTERNYWVKLLSEKENNKKDFWKVVRKMTDKVRKIFFKRTGPIKNEENELVDEDKKKAETMNKYFSNIGCKLAKEFTTKEDSMQTFMHQVTPTIENITLTDEQFQNQFKKINIHKAHGHDNKTSKEMEVIGENFSHVISNISRLSYRKWKYISTWKIGKVATAFKNGEWEDCGNYRNIPSKITESVVCETLDKHLENVIQENQWGYRKGLSTESSFLYLTETWKANIDKGKVVCVIFIDFRKAFDYVDHEILGFKMQGCGIGGHLLV